MFFGYLLHDTLYSLAFFKYVAMGSPAFLVHHGLGLICCVIGLYYQKMAIFGMYIQASHYWPGLGMFLNQHQDIYFTMLAAIAGFSGSYHAAAAHPRVHEGNGL